MKSLYLLTIILLSASCSNEIAEKIDTGDDTIRIGEIGTFANGAGEWRWETGDKLSVKVNGSTAEYTYTDAGKWTCGDPSFTKEKLGIVAPRSVELSFGNTSSEGRSQTTESAYRFADYMKGTGSLDGVTVSGELAHMNTDWEINITEGSGWGGKFESAMNEAAGLVISRGFGGGTINRLQAYHQGATFLIILSPKYVPQGTNMNFGTLTFGNSSATPESVQGKSATIFYTHNYDANELVGKRFTLTVKLDISLAVTITSITVKDFTGENISGELKP